MLLTENCSQTSASGPPIVRFNRTANCCEELASAGPPPGLSRFGDAAHLAAVGPQRFYLAIHLVEDLAYRGLQARPAVVGEVARQPPGFLQEHPHVAQLGELGLRHLPGRSPFPSVGHPRILLRDGHTPNFDLPRLPELPLYGVLRRSTRRRDTHTAGFMS